MTKQTQRTLTPEGYKRRFDAEKAALARHYCNAFKFWRACRFGPCRRQRQCRGDAQACLKQRAETVPRDIQFKVRQRLLQSTPAGAGAPEQLARQFLPDSF